MPEGLLDEPAHRDTAQGIEGTDQVRRSGVDGVNHGHLYFPMALAAGAVDSANATVALQIRDRPTLNGDGLHRNLVGHNDRNDDVTWALRAENGILGETILPGREYLAEVIDAVAIGVTLGFIERSEEHTSELQSRGHLVC